MIYASLAMRLFVFGTPRVEIDGKPVLIRRRKALAALIYLSLQDGPIGRESLAALLWPEAPPDEARRALRQAIWELRQAGLDRWLLADRETIRFVRRNDAWVDALLLRSTVAELDEMGSYSPQCQRQALAHAADCYRDAFLAGFTVCGSAEFDDWQRERVEEFRSAATRVLYALCGAHLACNELQQAEARARQLLSINSADEVAHRTLMQIYFQTGRRGDALRQYRICCQALQRELGEAPSAETEQLRASIHAARPFTEEKEACAGEPLSTFIGRESELALIAARLSSPACRLLTLTGVGGVGKTQLARRAAELNRHLFPDGVRFISLATLDAPTLLLPTIARFTAPEANAETEDELFAHLHRKRLLLVLDNFDHLLDGAGRVAEMLRALPSLKILVTSRERLRLTQEWVMEIEGLCCPPADESDVDRYPAVRLFLQAARKVKPDFALTAENRMDVARICRLVVGLPLAIELAATWTTKLPCGQIAEELTRSLDLLTTPLRDAEPRHESMRVTFENSWRLLTARQQKIFRRLSVFRDGFELEAAREIAGATVEDLFALMDKSLLRRNAQGRFELHELIRQYATEKLQARAHEVDPLHARHARFYAQLARNIKSGNFGPETENVRAGWDWATRHGSLAVVESYIEPIFRFYELHGLFDEGCESFARASERLRASGGALDRALLKQGVFNAHLGRNVEARALLCRALRLLRAAGLRREQATCLNRLGMVIYHLGDTEKSQQILEEALALYRALNDPEGIAQSLSRLAYVAGQARDYERAEKLVEESLMLSRLSGRPQEIANALNDLGFVLYLAGKYERAIRLLEESLELGRRINYLKCVAASLDNLGCIAAATGRREEARRFFSSSLATAIKIRAVPIALDVLYGLASLLVFNGCRKELALATFAFVVAHPATWEMTRRAAREAFAELAAEMPEQVVRTAQLKAEKESLDQAAVPFLAESEELILPPTAESAKRERKLEQP